jgi:hypothetical protein
MLDVKGVPIKSGYRPDWIGDFKPEFNCARVILDTSVPEVAPGNWAKALLEPLKPELWSNLAFGDLLLCKEGLKTVGEAIVMKVFEC